MKVVEQHYGGDWRDKLLNAWPLLRDADDIRTLFVTARDEQGWYTPESRSLFYNGYFFVRITNPGIFVHLKWKSGARLQFGAGWKLNGRFGLIARWQTDKSAAAGKHGPNVGQASGWERGTA